ncbi:sugar ABC transporter ATP-binding protein [Paracoccus sp. S-4012]|uniref:sugar ABC transporter ATP-binding protein n=1 Tax=Paracoccus sp. S-4012 TaxID=2665648 RepID=UPI001E33761D|nr:sugar ABC transporter ATP-binding protein [Paracoccus sp. S-4012]
MSKRFGATRALDGVHLRLRAGEVLGLVGGNGAGKSTLLKVLTGVYQADKGAMALAGRGFAPRSPAEAAAHGVALIPQELRVVPQMSVADNLFLGAWPVRAGGWMADRHAAERQARDWLARLGLDIDPSRPIGELSFAQRQSVVIARAMGRDARLLILDEPTASLGRDECERLFGMIERLKAGGTTCIYVSHRLDEVVALSERVIAMRDGRIVDEFTRGAYGISDLVAAISGKAVAHHATGEDRAPGAEVAAAADGLRLRRNWITGLHGLLGSGIETWLRAEFNAAGTGRPASAIAAGRGYVPSERARAIVPQLSVRDNILLPHLQRVSRFGTLSPAAMNRLVAPLMERLDIRPRDPMLAAGGLSGGNQQKVLFARWLVGETRLLLLDEPTHGVDVAARALIMERIRRFAEDGGAVVVHSVELDDLANLVDELILMQRGQLSAPIPRPRGGFDTLALKEIL